MGYRHVAALCSIGVVACEPSSPNVALRYHPPAGAVYHFAIEQRTQIAFVSGSPLLSALGKQNMLSRMYFTQTVKGPAAAGDGTEVEVVFENMTLEIPGISRDLIARELAKLNGMRAMVVFDERGKIVRNDFSQSPTPVPPDVARQMEAGIDALSMGFPDRPVRAGDSWTVNRELPLAQVPSADASAAGPAKTTMTVREIRITGGDTSVVIDMKMEFPPGPISLRLGNEPGTLRLEGTITGHQQFSISRGAILDGTVTGATKMNISSPSLGSKPMVMTSDVESSIFLLPTP
jgi:hypothetical protein